jgi:hypothetical protein
MDNETQPSQVTPVSDVADNKVNLSRRKLGLAGAAGTGLLMTVASRSAMAGENSCGSEMASGNLSKVLTGNDCGCSPGFWWNPVGTEKWNKYITLYPRTARFNATFGVAYLDPGKPLSECGPRATEHKLVTVLKDLDIPDAVVMHAIAALLNVAHFGATRYPATPVFASANDVTIAFRAAVAVASDTSQTRAFRKAAMTDFLKRCDVYAGATWCFGTPHGAL